MKLKSLVDMMLATRKSTDLQLRPRISSRLYSVSSRNSSDAKICQTRTRNVKWSKCSQSTWIRVAEDQGECQLEADWLTIGLSGKRGSVITKFFSIRSKVVAKSMPRRIPKVRSKSSGLSSRLLSNISKSGSYCSISSTTCCDFVPSLQSHRPLENKEPIISKDLHKHRWQHQEGFLPLLNFQFQSWRNEFACNRATLSP